MWNPQEAYKSTVGLCRNDMILMVENQDSSTEINDDLCDRSKPTRLNQTISGLRFVLQMMNFALQMMNFALKLMILMQMSRRPGGPLETAAASTEAI